MGRPSQPFTAAEIAAFADVEAGLSIRQGSIACGKSNQTFRERLFRWKEQGRPGASVLTAPAPAAATSDEWTIPTARTGHAAQVVQEKRAPAHGGKWKRFIAASDIHGDMQDEAACGVLWKFLDNWKPQIRCCLGDVWDFRPMRNGASNEEKQESMLRDYQMGIEWLERFFGASGQKILTLGNHDERLWEFAYHRRGLERDFAAGKVEFIEGKFAELGIEWVRYHKSRGVYPLTRRFSALHGFNHGVNALRETLKFYQSCMMGHTHTVESQSAAGIELKRGYIIGSMCNNDMEYNARQPNSMRQSNGFAFGAINSHSDDFVVWQAQGIDGDWLIPSDVVEVAA